MPGTGLRSSSEGPELILAVPLDTARIRALLLDIEGTTTPVAFVYQVLFPYARSHVREFLEAHRETAAVRADIEALYREYLVDERNDLEPPVWRGDAAENELDSVVAYVRWLMERDRKSTPLKSLQGKIWEAGYRNATLRAEVYPDVPAAFARWRRQKREIAIFSSGSVLAQKLLFAHSTVGDLTPWIDTYFDTATGPKFDAESYRRIAAALGYLPGQVLFVSDVVAELDAACGAGMQTALRVRPAPYRDGTRSDAADPATGEHIVIRSLDEVLP